MNRRKSSLKRYVAYAASVIGVGLVVIVGIALFLFEHFFRAHVLSDLEKEKIIIESSEFVQSQSISDDWCEKASLRTSYPLLLLTLNGETLCSKDFADIGFSIKHPTAAIDKIEVLPSSDGSLLKQHLIFSDTILLEASKTPAVVALATPLNELHKVVGSLALQLGIVAFVIFCLLSLFAIRMYRRVIQSLNEMKDSAQALARGSFSHSIPKYRVSEVDALANAMNRMRKELMHLEQVRSDFVANVSHELKTPVTSIKGFVETLIAGAAEDVEDRNKFLQIISRQANRLISIIEDLLTLSRLESERAVELLVMQDVNAEDLLTSVTEVCRARADQKSIQLEVHSKPNIEIQIDRSLMEQALINLVDNAIKHSGLNTRVKVSLEELDGSHLINVEDTGPGIPEEHLARLFERFYRVDKARSRNQGGTGLGLAIVKHVVGLHGGTVSVASAVGKGSIFSISLPKPEN